MKASKVATFVLFTVIFISSYSVSGCKEEITVQPENSVKMVNAAITKDSLDCSCIINPSEEITAEEVEMLKFMREEEKMARDVYTTLSAQYALPIFKNIPKGEQYHMDQVLCLLNYYNIEDPASTETGVFENSDLQELYNNLIAQGSLSLVDALTVGATIEDVDINDLGQNILQTENPAIISNFTHLKCGSGNHMRAFSAILSKKGVVYVPQFISQGEYDQIITSNHQYCGNL